MKLTVQILAILTESNIGTSFSLSPLGHTFLFYGTCINYVPVIHDSTARRSL